MYKNVTKYEKVLENVTKCTKILPITEILIRTPVERPSLCIVELLNLNRTIVTKRAKMWPTSATIVNN